MAADCCEQMELRIFVLSRQHFFGTAAKQKLDSQCVSKFFLGRSFDPRRGHATNLCMELSRTVGYSPAKFAQEAPAMFSHDPSTNRLSLLGEPPWIADDNGAWNYCVDCWERFFSTGDKTVQHVPFRDKASQANMVVSWRDRKRKAEELSNDEI